MEYRRINATEIDALWELQKQYKSEIDEDEIAMWKCINLLAFQFSWEIFLRLNR